MVHGSPAPDVSDLHAFVTAARADHAPAAQGHAMQPAWGCMHAHQQAPQEPHHGERADRRKATRRTAARLRRIHASIPKPGHDGRWPRRRIAEVQSRISSFCHRRLSPVKPTYAVRGPATSRCRSKNPRSHETFLRGGIPAAAARQATHKNATPVFGGCMCLAAKTAGSAVTAPRAEEHSDQQHAETEYAQ